jgi:cation transport regulator ChaC
MRCPNARPIGSGTIIGYRITFRGNARCRGVANIEPRKGSTVPVGLFEITRADERALDRYEGYPNLYTKVILPVQIQGQTVKAMVYVMTPGHKFSAPSTYYLNVIKMGYRDFGFESSRSLTYAATHPVKGVNV